MKTCLWSMHLQSGHGESWGLEWASSPQTCVFRFSPLAKLCLKVHCFNLFPSGIYFNHLLIQFLCQRLDDKVIPCRALLRLLAWVPLAAWPLTQTQWPSNPAQATPLPSKSLLCFSFGCIRVVSSATWQPMWSPHLSLYFAPWIFTDFNRRLLIASFTPISKLNESSLAHSSSRWSLCP